MNTLNETWKVAPETNSLVSVSNYGRVRKRKKKDIGTWSDIVPRKTKAGYPEVSVVIKGKQRLMRVHRLVAMSFIPNPENKPQINHKDGVKDNNHISNLEWCTPSENITHAWHTGLISKGDDWEEKDVVVRARVDIDEKAKFYEACKKRGETPSEVIRRMMEKYTEDE